MTEDKTGSMPSTKEAWITPTEAEAEEALTDLVDGPIRINSEEDIDSLPEADVQIRAEDRERKELEDAREKLRNLPGN